MELVYADAMDPAPFLAAAEIALSLVARPEVAAKWPAESACAGMSVGGLAHHLLKQIANTQLVLEALPNDGEVIDAREHYARAEWVGADLDAPVNIGVRERSDLEAEAGPDAVLRWGRDAYDQVAILLSSPRIPEVVSPPWLTWSMTTDDYLTTRLVELAVHSDDLAASIGVPTPEFPAAVIERVLQVLTAAALRRHGQAALLRTLSRPQRAPESISAF